MRRIESPNGLVYDQGHVIIVNGKEQLEFRNQIQEPITRNDRMYFRANCIMIQNAGNTIVKLDNEWTLFPCGSKMWGTPESIHINIVKHTVHFITPPDSPDDFVQDNRLEISLIHLHHPAYGSRYQEKGQIQFSNESARVY